MDAASASDPQGPSGRPGAPTSLDDVADIADIVVLTTGPDRRIVAVDGPCARLMGVEADALIGHEPTEFLHPADIDWRDRVRADLMSIGRAAGRARVRRSAVDYAWMETRLAARPDGGAVLVLRPIEERPDADLATRIDPLVMLEAERDATGAVVDMRCVMANDAAAAAFGTTVGGLLGSRVGEMLPLKDAGNVIDWCRQALAGGDVAIDDESWSDPGGGPTRYVDMRAVGAGDSVRLTWRDATDRHAVSAALAEREAAYRLIADNATDVILRSSTHEVEWVSPSVTEVLGWQPADIVGRRVSDFMHPDDLRRVRRMQHDLLTDGATEGRTTARFRTASGQWRWMSDHGRAILGPDGSVLGGIDSLRDVQAEYEATEALARGERELRAIIDTLHDPWVRLEAVRDADGAIVDFTFADANEAACEANHTPRAQLIGARLLEVVPEHGPSGVFDRYARVVETGETLVEDDEPFTSPFDGHVRRFDNRAVKVGDGISLTWRDVTERFEARQRLRLQAEQDVLTGVANRRQLERRMGEILTRTPRTGDRVAVLYCDLDHFKDVNDTLGHAAGDEVLTSVARQIRTVIREGDVVARLGGDEFVLILDGVRDADDALAVARKVSDAVAVPVRVNETTVYPHASIGLAVAEAGEDPTHVLARADRALYEAKHAGRNRVSVAAPRGATAG